LPSARATEKITPLTPAATAVCREAIDTRTDPGTAVCAAVPVFAADAAGPVHTGSDPARTDPATTPAITALSCAAAPAGAAPAPPPAADSVAVAAPAAGQVTGVRCHGCRTGTLTLRSGTANTGTGFACATGRSLAGPDSPLAPPGGCVIPVSNGTPASTALATVRSRRPRPRQVHLTTPRNDLAIKAPQANCGPVTGRQTGMTQTLRGCNVALARRYRHAVRPGRASCIGRGEHIRKE
jgi:hypothetical protein